jgi:transglutaminase-like putative cysteine protease
LASVAAARQERPPKEAQRLRLIPAEGWLTFLLHLAIVLGAVAAIQREDWANDLSILTPIATLAVLEGFLLAKTRISDLSAHLVSFVAAIVVSVLLTAATMDDVDAGWRSRLHILWDRGEAWYRQAESGRGSDDSELFVLLMGITVWLIAYSSAWMLYRRHWLIASLLLPGGMLTINYAYARDASPGPIFFFGFACCLLAARYHAYERQVEWTRSRIPSPEQLPWQFVRGGLTVTTLAVIMAWSLPANAPDPVLNQVADRIERPWQAIQDQWNDWMSNFGNTGRRGGRFAAFNESFRLGGDLNLSDEKVAVVTSDHPVYLAAHRYNRYDGHGWSTDVESTFRGDKSSATDWAPLVTFEPGNQLFLSPAMTKDRDNDQATVTLLKSKGDLLLTIDTYLSSTERASVQLGWQQLNNARYQVSGVDASIAPVDLREFVALLQQTTFTYDDQSNQWVASDPAARDLVAQMQEVLRGRHLDTTWEFNDNGQVETLIVNGQLPVYDDVEAVRVDNTPNDGDQYQVNGLESVASAEALKSAPTNDPGFILARYLGNPTTVTQRTVDLAHQVTANASNRYDQALAIQEYLRNTFPYDENVDTPPADQDAVDFFLFDGKRGYCEYFASSMVVMLRSLNIPARLVAGYHSAPFDQESGGYLYREKQAHTWVEVYFPGYGWIPFEPTPAVDRIDLAQDQPAEAAASPTVEPTQVPDEPAPTPTLMPTPLGTPAPNTITNSRDGDGESSTFDRIVAGVARVIAVVALLVIAVALIGSISWHWRLRGLRPGAAMFARVQRVGKWWGVKPDATMTPIEFARELGRVAPAVRRPVRIVAELYETEQYGKSLPDPQTTKAAKRAWTDTRNSLLKSLPSWRKKFWKGRNRD